MSSLENSARSGLFALWELLSLLAPYSVRERERSVQPGVLGCEGAFLFDLTPDPFFLFYNLRLVALAASQFKRRTEEIVFLLPVHSTSADPTPICLRALER